MTATKKTDESPLRIVQLQAENVKKLTAVSITPTGSLVKITGRNGAGKTSVLDAIMWAIAGADKVQSEPIRKGQTNASIRIDMGDVIVTRKFRKREDGSTTSSVVLENADGSRHTSPQKMLDSWLGKLTIDPLEFARMKPKEQFDALKGMVPNYDFEKMAGLNRGDYDKRTDVNRSAKEATTLAQAIEIPASVPKAKVDEAALVDEIASVGEFNASIEQRKERRAQARKEADAQLTQQQKHIDRAAELRQQAADQDALAVACLNEAQAIDKKLDDAPPLPEPKDATEVRARLEKAKADNALIDRAALRASHLETASRLEAEADTLTKSIESREAAKKAAIAAAKLPVDGIEFGDGAILLNGNPFDQASGAERLRTSIAIAMAGKPRIRVIRVCDGSLLDDDGIKLVAGMAEEHGYQVWVEAVDSSGKTGIVIEDGHVASTPETRAQQGELLSAAE
jgi:energy-coupling factor transporter ATP-binding protein EcfA2